MNTEEIVEFVSGKIKEHPDAIETIVANPEGIIKQMVITIGKEASDDDVKAAVESLTSKIVKNADGSWNLDKL